MRIAIVYDCLYPNTIGGAERWYRNLAERLGQTHEVTYLTRKQWAKEGPGTPFETIAVAPGWKLYARSGRRNILTPIRFGWGVFWHLLRHADRYDAVHTASFPYFSIPGAWAALRLRRSKAPVVVDWHELWAKQYWLDYLGPVTGRIGFAVQNLCVRLVDRSFAFSHLVENRLHAMGNRGPVTRLTGEFEKPRAEIEVVETPPDPPVVVFAGRHVAEKRVRAIPAAILAVREKYPDLTCLILGDGPDTPALREEVTEFGLEKVIEVRGRVSGEEVAIALANSTCLLQPSAREGYGLVVVEACVVGTPVVVVAGAENAATELIDPGRNGQIAKSATPDELAQAVLACVDGGRDLRQSTIEWYRENRDALSLDSSIQAIESDYWELQRVTGPSVN